MTASLKVFQPDQDDRPLSLRAAFEAYLLEELVRDRAPATKQAYLQAINRFEEFLAGGDFAGGVSGTVSTTTHFPPQGGPEGTADGTGQPSGPDIDVRRIDDRLLAHFRGWLDERQVSGSTIGKYWRCLRAIFRRLGPRVPGNPRGVGLLESMPYMPTPAAGVSAKRIVTPERLAALYRACEIATWPRHPELPAVLCWRTLLVLLFTLGMRTGDAVRLTWSSVWFEPESPDPDCLVTCPHGWIQFVPTKTARHKPAPLTLPMSAVLADHLLRLRKDRLRVFPFGGAPAQRFYDQWTEIVAESGVQPAVQLRELRKTCNSAHNRNKPGIGRWVLGHAARDVNERHYLRVDEDLVEAMELLGYPDVISDQLGRTLERQLSLF